MLKLWNRIIKKIAFKVSSQATEKREALLDLLEQNGNKISESETLFFVKNSAFSYQLRKKGSDVDVFRQVITSREYQPLIDFLEINNKNPKLILDCGANIGLTSMQFAYHFPNSLILSIEPDADNFKQLTENVKGFKNVTPLQNAVWSSSEILKIDRSFRDGRDWSIRTVKKTENAYQDVQSITINEILENTDYTEIDLLKIDIEGAESELFKDEKVYSFLYKTKCIAIEIHDECVDRIHIYTILKKIGFTLFNTGELTIGIRH